MTGQRIVARGAVASEDKFKLSADFSFLCLTDKSLYKVFEGSARRRSASWRDKVGSDTFYGHKGTGKQKLLSHNLYLSKLADQQSYFLY